MSPSPTHPRTPSFCATRPDPALPHPTPPQPAAPHPSTCAHTAVAIRWRWRHSSNRVACAAKLKCEKLFQVSRAYALGNGLAWRRCSDSPGSADALRPAVTGCVQPLLQARAVLHCRITICRIHSCPSLRALKPPCCTASHRISPIVNIGAYHRRRRSLVRGESSALPGMDSGAEYPIVILPLPLSLSRPISSHPSVRAAHPLTIRSRRVVPLSNETVRSTPILICLYCTLICSARVRIRACSAAHTCCPSRSSKSPRVTALS